MTQATHGYTETSLKRLTEKASDFLGIWAYLLDVVVQLLCKLVVVPSAQLAHTQRIKYGKQSWKQRPKENQVNDSIVALLKPESMVSEPSEQKRINHT